MESTSPAGIKRRRRLLIATLAALIALGGAGLAIRAWLFTDLPSIDALDDGLHTPSVRITDRHGRPLYEVIGDNVGRHTVVPLETIPSACREATIATEDAHFYTNPGVDVRAIVRAVWVNLRGGEVLSGGSTITQQVARNLLLGPQEASERTLTRKLRESILAYRLARRYSKDDILALYLNQTYYGNLAYGVEAAAQAYYGKSVNELDLAECALLAGLPQSPARYDPLTDPAAARERQAVVLGLMVRSGYITGEEAEQAKREQLRFASTPFPIEAPHFVTLVWAELSDLLPPERLAAGGLQVRTTLDLDWQHQAEAIARRHLELLNTPKPNDPPHNAHNAALVALDPHTGQILALLGSPDYFDPSISGAINLALAPRQPGSAIKPITYAAALDPTRDNPWTAAMMILDVHTSFVTKEGYSYAPTNYDRGEHGPVLVREALASSYNIPAVITLKAVGIPTMTQLASEMGITTFTDPDRYDLSITLGGGEVRLLELTTAYAVFANEGRSVHPTGILEVRDADGEIIYRWRPRQDRQVIDPRVAWLISDILSDNLARAPSFGTHSILQIGRPAAVKTGTTTDYRDNWTVGFTPNLVVGVWVGNADYSPMVNVSGVSGAGPIWHHFVRQVLKGKPELAFERPDGMTRVEVCVLSGLLPTPDCPHTRLEWFIAGTEPTQADNIYRRVEVDAATGLPADESTPPERREWQVYLDLPPQAHEWARRNHLPLVPEALAVPHASTPGELMMASPDANTVFRIAPGLPGEAQRLRLVAVGPPGTRDVTILLDGVPLETRQTPLFEAYWPLEVGDHQVWAVGTDAEGQQTRSDPIPFTVLPPE
jgi:1A family penicillin-binding protein